MYYAKQTLRNKKTNQLASLHPSKQNKSIWNWELSDQTIFIDEYGNVFFDNSDNWTHIEDWFDRSCYGRFSFLEPPPLKKNQYIDIRLKEFLVSNEEREIKTKQAYKRWYDHIINELDNINKNEFKINNVFADGSICHKMKNYFIDKMNALPLYTRVNTNYYEYKESQSRIFIHKNKKYVLDDNTIFEVE